MNRQRWPWVLAIVIGIAAVLIVGVAAYTAGLNATAVGPGRIHGPLMYRTFGHYDGYGLGFGFGPLGFLVGVGLIALVVGGVVALFSRPRAAGRDVPGPRPTGEPTPPESRQSFEAWHREAHGSAPDAPPPAGPADQPAGPPPA